MTDTRIQSPSPTRSVSSSVRSNANTDSQSYRRRKALLGFGEPRARSVVQSNQSMEESREPSESSCVNELDLTQHSCVEDHTTKSSSSRSRSRQGPAPEHTSSSLSKKKDRESEESLTIHAGNDNNNPSSTSKTIGTSSPVTRLQRQMLKHRELRPKYVDAPQIELVHSLESALSQDTTAAEITSTTSYNHKNSDSANVNEQVKLKKQKVISTPVTRKECNESIQENEQKTASWWLTMFQRMEEKHEKDKAEWQEQLQSAKEKKVQYKDELKQNLASKLEWLEDHMTSPKHILPGMASVPTLSDDSSYNGYRRYRTVSSNNKTYHLHYDINATPSLGSSSKSVGDGGVEVTIDAADHMKRYQELERFLQETLRQHEMDRAEWVRTLEEAAEMTQAGEEMTASQQKQLKDMQHELDRANQRQKIQLKEKSEVLHELLELTEQQHDEEMQVWKERQREIENVVTQLQIEKTELINEKEEYQKELEQVRDRVDQLVAEKEESKKDFEKLEIKSVEMITDNDTLKKEKDAMLREIEKLNKDLQDYKEETRNYRAQAADYTEQAALRSNSTYRQEALDRAAAERDCYRQEAESLRKELENVKKNSQKRSSMKVPSPSRSVSGSPTILRLQNDPGKDIATKYKEAVEKHTELVSRIRKLEDQRAADRGSFKLQLEAALSESRKLQEEKVALENRILTLMESHGKELHDLQEKGKRLESELEQRCEQVFEIQDSASVDKQEEAQQLKLDLHRLEAENKLRCGQLIESHQQEVQGLNEELLKIKEFRESLEKSLKDEISKVNTQLEMQTKSLNEYKGLHQKAIKRLDQALAEKTRLMNELNDIRNRDKIEKDVSGKLESHQKGISKAVEELRKEVMTIRDTLSVSSTTSSAIGSVQLDDFRADLSQIQHTLNDAVAELTLESDALIHSRDAILNAATGVSKTFNETAGYASMLEQQERFLTELSDLRESVNKAMEDRSSTKDCDNVVVTRELINELQEKEASLASTTVELRYLNEKLTQEIEAHQLAQSTICAMKEQSENNEAEILTLRSTNAKLIQKLRTAGMRFDANILSSKMNNSCDDLSTVGTPRSMSMTGEESFAVLDEALALATGLTDIVGNRGSSAMEMLESMQEMIDSPLQSPITSAASRRRNRQVFDFLTGGVEVIHEEASRVSSLNDTNAILYDESDSLRLLSQESTDSKSSLQLVVEQLYTRCEMLERERMELMEATLDLLELAREANTEELQRALNIAQRKSMKEMQKLHTKNYQDQERMFHRLCTQCDIYQKKQQRQGEIAYSHIAKGRQSV